MCKACGKKGSAKMKSQALLAKVSKNNQLLNGEVEGVMFRYTGKKARTEFIGAKTRLKYVTGAGENHKYIKVHPDDVEFFLGLSNFFVMEEPVLRREKPEEEKVITLIEFLEATENTEVVELPEEKEEILEVSEEIEVVEILEKQEEVSEVSEETKEQKESKSKKKK